MKKLLTALIAVVAASCSDTVTMPRQLMTELTSEVQFLMFTPDAFENSQKVASFWAVRGEDRSLVLRYADTGRKYLRFEVDSTSLERWPDGTAFQPGDSVQITIEADPDGRWMFHFTPAGLTFSASAPAKLTLEYGRSVNAGLLAPRIYKRDQPFNPWEPVPTTRLTDLVVRADVYDFTDFGLAIN